MTKKKEDKDLLAMCGEYAVASELCKNGFNASITYGNAKAQCSRSCSFRVISYC